MPVYNAEDYLPSALDSIVQQDDGSIELICVNDGSTDGSGDILDSYASRYSFITVINQHNQGITAARNTALAASHGKWICFADNDDIVADKAVRIMHQQIADDLDIVYFNFERFSSGQPSQETNIIKNSRILNFADIERMQEDCINRFRKHRPLIPTTLLITPWAKIYRRDFLFQHELQFRNEVTHEEDVVFNLEVLSYAKRAKWVEYTTYYYRISINSEIHRYRPRIVESSKQTLKAYHEIIENRYKDRPEFQSLYEYRVLWEMLYCVFLGPMHILNPASYKERKRQFNALFSSDSQFHDVFCHVSLFRFGFTQTVLAVLVRCHQFWLLNLLGKVIYGVRRG
jgi:glycosyltransferase involved in cell wall biosynthesis